MRHVLLCTLLVFVSFGLTINEASARGFSGSRGFGMMRSKSLFTHAPRAQKAAYTKTTRQTNNSRWRGALTGLLLGSVLTSLFMGNGLGSTLFSWLILGMIVYFLVNLLRRKKQDNLR